MALYPKMNSTAVKRIIFNGSFLQQPQTGVQRYARETLLALDDLLGVSGKLKSVPAILASPAGSPSISLRHIKTVELARFSGHLWEQTTLAQFCRDSLLVNFNYSGPLALRHQVITIHDATVAEIPSAFSARYRFIHKLLIRTLRDRVAAIMTVSQFSRNELRRHYRIQREIVVGREGWEHSVATGKSEATLRLYNLEARGYVLLVGSIKPNKNLQLVLKALAIVRNFEMDVAIVGLGDRRIFQHVDLSCSTIRALGFVDDDSLNHLYKNAEWLLIPSIYEGFGLPAIEALANGCPVLAANAGALPEVCGHAALYFDPFDARALADLLDRITIDPALRESTLANGRSQLEKFRWRANAEVVAGVIDRALFPAGEFGVA